MMLPGPQGEEPMLPASHGTAPDPAAFLPRLEPGRILLWVLKRCWLVIVPALLLGLLAWKWAAGQQKIYRATGSVYVETSAPVVIDNIKPVSTEQTEGLEQLRSVEQGLAATTLFNRLIDSRKLDADSTFAPAGQTREDLIQLLVGRVKVELRRGSRLIDISVDDSDPARARDLVQGIVSEYEAWTTERQRGTTQKASEGLAREEANLRARLEATAKEIQDFREKHPVPGLNDGEGRSGAGDSLSALGQQLSQATTERLRIEAEYEAYLKFDASDPESIAGVSRTEQGAEVMALVRALQQREADFTRVKERYLYKHPVFIDAEGAVKTAHKQLAETVKAAGQALEQRYAIANGNERKLTAAVETARKTAVEADGVRDQFRELTRRATAEQELHGSILRRLRETEMAASVPASFLRWTDAPLVPSQPVRPRKIVYAAGGVALGGMFGCVLLLLAGVSDRKIRSSAAASKTIGSPLLASIPPVGPPGEAMVMMSDPASDGAEAFRRLRVVLAPSAGENAGRTIAFVSARSGEGKSFCALNYATSLAMQGQRTLLIDADLRSPGISRDYFQGGDESGLGAYLKGNTEAASACYATALPNLYLISSGPMRPDAGELLGGTRFPSLLEDAYRWFDRVVIDTPAVLTASEALAASRYADRVCLVVREGVSDRRDLKRAADLLRSTGANLVGFLWNEATRRAVSPVGGGPLVPASRVGIGGPQPVAVEQATRHHLSVIPKTKSPRQTMRTI